MSQQLKFSRQREKILETLRGTVCHPSADWIYTQLKPQMPDLSLGTVYRNLNLLCSMGQIHRLNFGPGIDRFDGNIKAHYHFFCEKCGSLSDIPLDCIENLDALAGQTCGHTISGHRIQFYGVCENCSQPSN